MTNGEPSFTLRGEGGNTLEVVVGYPTQSDSEDFWDANWISAAIDIRVGAFRGRVAASLRREDFPAFRDALRELDRDLSGRATFRTMEEWIEIEIAGDGRGHFTASGSVVDDLGGGNRLHFELRFDQTHLPTLLKELDVVVKRRPVIGSP